MKHKFIKLDEWGELYIDKILFEAGYPVLFTCINGNRDLFICVCCQNNENGTKWLISKTTAGHVAKMLENGMTIRELFLEDEENRFSVNALGGEIEIVKNDKKDWSKDSIYPPKANEYMDAEDGEVEEEIRYFENFDLKYEAFDISDKSYQVRFDSLSDTMPSAVDIVVSVNVKDTINIHSSEVVKVYVLIEKMQLDRTYFAERMMKYLSAVASHKKETMIKETIIYEYTSKQKNIFDMENEMDADLLDAA